MKKIIVLLSALVASATIAFAQNDFVLTEQLFSRIAVNPAGTGNDENVNIFSLNRFQYAGADGAPFSTLLNVHGYFDKANSGVGLTFLRACCSEYQHQLYEPYCLFTFLLYFRRELTFSLMASTCSALFQLSSKYLNAQVSLSVTGDSTSLSPTLSSGRALSPMD